MRLKYLNVYNEITVILEWFYLYEFNPEEAKVFERAWRI